MFDRATVLNYFRSRDRGWILALLAAVFLLYSPFLGSPLFFDDLTFFYGGIASRYAHSWFHLDLRWLPHATLGWTEMLFSNVVTHFFHLGNVLLHAGNTLLLFYLLRRLMAAATGAGERTGAVAWGAWFGALLFALHPVAVFAAGYVVQRSILMATFFALLTQLTYLRGLLTGQARWFALAVLCYFMAVFSKEHSVLTPALLAAETLLLRPGIRARARSLWVTWGALFCVGLLVALRAKGVFGVPYEPLAAELFKNEGVAHSSETQQHLLSVLTQGGLYFKYLLLWVLPAPGWTSVDMREPFIASLSDWKGWAGMAAYLLYGGVALRLLLKGGRMGLLGLALLYPWLQFLLEFSTIRVQEPFVLYRSYLWMPGLALLVPLLLQQWTSRSIRYGLAIAALALAALAAHQLWVFADGYRLWKQAEQALPNDRIAGADRIYFNLGQAEEGRGMLTQAVADLEHSLALSPQYAPVHFELGWIYLREGRDRDAMVQFDQAIAIDPNMGGAYFGKAMILKQRHEDAQAAAMMEKACDLNSQIACLIVRRRIDR
jgi:protein O-mannosyl-transferase